MKLLKKSNEIIETEVLLYVMMKQQYFCLII